MSVKVSSWVWHEARDRRGLEVSGNELVLMLALADVADDNGRCRFVDDEAGLTYDSLAEKVRVHRRTVIRMVAALREAGLIDQVKGRKGTPNEFRVLVPWAARSGDNLAPNGDEADPDSVTTGADSVTTDAVFGDNSNIGTSLTRTRKKSVEASGVEEAAPVTVGMRFAQPLCNVLSAALTGNGVKHTVSKQWLADARLLVDKDERDPHEAKALIEWATADPFWRSNILSMPKFREKYDQLRLQRGGGRKLGVVERGRDADAILRERAAQRGQKAVAS